MTPGKCNAIPMAKTNHRWNDNNTIDNNNAIVDTLTYLYLSPPTENSDSNSIQIIVVLL